MEEIIDFDQWYLNHKIEVIYWAVYDPDTGKVKGIYPNDSADAHKNKIKIDNEIAEAIGDGRIFLSNCYVDFESDSLAITEIKSLLKIDDILHRIVNDKWSDIDNPDLKMIYKKNILRFILNEKIKGKKRIHYNGDTIMNFYITEYNDPNILFEKVDIQLDKLIHTDIIFEINLPKNFSIYTRRIFKKYVLIDENNRI